MRNLYLFLAIIISGLSACKQVEKPNEATVLTAIQNYLQNQNAVNTVIIGVGTIDFNGANAQQLLPKYKKLANENYISFGTKKKSNTTKDSFLQGEFLDENPAKKNNMMQVSILPKSEPFISQKIGGKYLLKSSEWSSKGAKIESIEARAEQKFRVSVILGLEKTSFSILEDLDSSFSRKVYLIKLNAEQQWEVEGELKK